MQARRRPAARSSCGVWLGWLGGVERLVFGSQPAACSGHGVDLDCNLISRGSRGWGRGALHRSFHPGFCPDKSSEGNFFAQEPAWRRSSSPGIYCFDSSSKIFGNNHCKLHNPVPIQCSPPLRSAPHPRATVIPAMALCLVTLGCEV